MGTIPWYKSKGVWSGIISAVIGAGTAICQVVGFDLNSNALFGIVISLLGAFGLYARVTATSIVTK